MSIFIILMIVAATPWALTISANRTGRRSDGTKTKKVKEVVKPLFYSSLRGGVVV